MPPGVMRLHRAPREPLKGCRRGGRGVSDFLPAPASSSRPAPQPPRSCCPRAGRARRRCLLALVLFPALILGDQWHSHQIADLRDDTARLVALALLALAISAALAAVFHRWPILLPLAIVAALPFRVPFMPAETRRICSSRSTSSSRVESWRPRSNLVV